MTVATVLPALPGAIRSNPLADADVQFEDGIFDITNNPLDHGGIGAGELPPTELQVQAMIQATPSQSIFSC